MPVRQKVALLLTDLEMPEMDGFTLTRQMKTDDVLKSVPIVIHSSLSGSANESHAQRVGADGYVANFVPTELARAIAKALSGADPLVSSAMTSLTHRCQDILYTWALSKPPFPSSLEPLWRQRRLSRARVFCAAKRTLDSRRCLHRISITGKRGPAPRHRKRLPPG